MGSRAIDKEGKNILNPPMNGGTALYIRYKPTIISVRIDMFQDCYYLIFNTDICIASRSDSPARREG